VTAQQPTHRTTRAIDWPATKKAIRVALVGWSAFTLVPVALVAGGVAVVDRSEKLGAVLLGVGFSLLILGPCMLWITRRMRRAARAHPWTVWRMRYATDARYEWVTLLDSAGNPVSQLIVSSWAWQVGKLIDESNTEVWFAGDPKAYGIIATPGGGRPRHAYVPRFPNLRPPPPASRTHAPRHAK
jgi:hypothetical protein